MSLLTFSFLPALLLLCFGGLLAVWIFYFYKPDREIEKLALKFGWVVLSAYLLWIGLISFGQGQVPVLTIGQISAFLGFLIWADQMYVHQRIPQKILVVLPLITVILLLLVSVTVGMKPNDAPQQLHGAWSAVHITLSLAGVAMLLGGGVYGAGSLILNRQLRGRKFGSLFQSLPSLGEMHRLRTVALYLGWLLITVSLASSIVWMFLAREGNPGSFSHLHAMFALWAVVSVLAMSERFRWLGDHKQARLSVVLSALILVLLMASVVEMFLGGQS